MRKKKVASPFKNVDKRFSIKTRLQRYFLILSLGIILIMSVFSLFYFYFSIRREAESLVRNKLLLAEVFLENIKKETSTFTRNLAEERAIQIGLQLDSGNRIQEYLMSLPENTNNFEVSIFDETGVCLTENMAISMEENNLLDKALNGTPITDITNLRFENKNSPGFVSIYPILQNGEIIGAVMTRFVFENNLNFFTDVGTNLGCEIGLYNNGKTVVSTSDLRIDSELYAQISVMDNNYEVINLTSVGLNEYISLKDLSGNPCCVLHIHISSYSYFQIFSTVIIFYFGLAILITAIVISLVLKISASILNPIEHLMRSVNIVRHGDLAHEVILEVQDEIGRLGAAFNELRAQLNDKIITIEDMNTSLEKTIEERTETLNILNEKMKHYLSPQLYASIAGGKRDTSVDKHFRKKLTIFFSDVANFTATTESLEPEDLSNLLNSYLDNMAQIAEKYGGTIDKYVGDAIMVFFGDPEFTSDKDHALRAVKMAMEMQDRMISFREEWRERGIERPFHVRVGINTGYCTIGNFGSEMKMDYTIIGNNVNMAARFEAAAEPDTILLSPDTYALIKDEIECQEAGVFNLKGIPEPVKGYRPIHLLSKKEINSALTITNDNELVFRNKTLNLSKLSKGEKRELLLSFKDIFEKIKKS